MRRRPFLVSMFTGLILLLGFWELAEDFAYSARVIEFDVAVNVAIASLRTPWLTEVMSLLTTLGGFIVVTTAFALLVWWQFRASQRTGAVFSAVVVLGGALLSTTAKGKFARLRPLEDGAVAMMPDSYSFPSGHSMASLCLAAALINAVMQSGMSRSRKAWSVAALITYPLLVGFSRVYLGVHFPSDVIASWLLGGALISLAMGVTFLMPADS